MELLINEHTDSCAAFNFIALYVPERKIDIIFARFLNEFLKLYLPA